MDTHDRDAMFLIARNFTLRGILTEERAKALAAERRPSLEGAEVDEALTTTAETFIEELIPMAAQSTHPIAVVAENGSLLGEVRRGALLSGMSDTD